MKLSDFLNEHNVLLAANPGGASTKAEALVALADRLAESAEFDSQTMLRAVLRREKLMSTGIGHGLAVPHVRLDGLRRPAVAVGVFPRGVEGYESLDNEPVRIIILIAAPSGQHETYIRLLATVAEVLKQEELRQAVIGAANSAEVYRILTEGGR